MTEPEGLGLANEPPRKTAVHYMFFLDWAEEKGELPAPTVQTDATHPSRPWKSKTTGAT
jgi:hypothetical protein